MTTPAPSTLRCACCGGDTIGRQWHNQDDGFGLCPQCTEWIKGRDRLTPGEMEFTYGVDGVHYNVPAESR